MKGIDARVLEGGIRGFEASGRPLTQGATP
jgi:hypothetical protein